ncbi:hypothetical protein KYC5002_16715 [Archangium violaceum]|uniref:hypothetical protein n=1 Tax=Archangium violaceum TaxID=83451 RepID=UPI002B2D19B1|nr:hypothetical protein KYC5002_16715 [Archangium gephyra]
MMCRNSSSLVLMLPLLALLGCDPGGGGGNSPQVTVAVDPAAVTLPMAGTQRFTATVTGASDTSVTWTATGGEITQAGGFTAPRQEGTYRVRATSVADTARYAESVVTVTKPPPPTIQAFTAAASTINVGEGTTLDWEVTGATSLSIEPDVGTVTGTSVTVSPATTTTYTLTATNEGGSVTATTTVTVRQRPTISSFTAASAMINVGQSTTLNWEVAGATSLSIEPGVGTVAGTSVTVTPATTTTYTLTATNEAGSVTATTTVTVRQLPAISSFTAASATINVGQSTTLNWEVEGATSLSIAPAVGTVTGTSVTVTPATTTTYTLTATNEAGSVTATTTVTVRQRPTISSFTAASATINVGQSTTLNWEVEGATSLSIAPGVGTVTGTSVTVTPATTTTYTLTATNEAGSVTATATVTVRQRPTISSFTAASATINAGQSTTLSWTATGATSLSITPGVGTVTGTSVTVSPATTTTYTLTATNEAGSVTATTTVTVRQPPAISSFTAASATINAGQSTTLNWAATGATSLSITPGVGTVTGTSVTVSPATTTTYTLTATNAAGSVTATTTVTVRQPPAISSFTAAPTTITAGQSATLSWTSTGATSLSIAPGVGTVTGTSVTVTPSSTTTYTLMATNDAGNVTATATVTVNPPAADTWASLSWANELPGNYDSDVYRWLDAGKQQRTAVLTRNTARDPGGSYGGMLRQFRFYTGTSERVATGTGASSGPGYIWNGWGYVVSHFTGNGVSHSGSLAGSYRRVFVGSHHAIHEFSWNLPIGGTPVKVTVHWFFATGRDHPVYAVTFDTSAAGPSGLPTSADSRTPYGDIAWDGDGTNAYVDGVKWGDKYKFFSRTEPFTAQSQWDYSQPNVVPYTMLYSRAADAEMGMVQTLDWLQHNTGGTWFTDNWGRTSETRVGSFDGWMMPPNWNWPYQMCQYEMDSYSQTRSKRLAWGLMYDAVGKPSYYGYGYEGSFVGHPYQSYSVFMVMGQQSAGEVLAQATHVERMLKARLSVTQGAVVTSGPGGVARSDSATYPVPGYNSNYAAHELQADLSGLFNATLNAAGGELQNPLFMVRAAAGVPARLYLDGVLLKADVDYFASFDSTSGVLWLTLNRAWSGSHTLASGT